MKATLDAAKINNTISTLLLRINDRFPESGLHKLCQHLAALGQETAQTAAEIGRPIVGLRLASSLLSLIFIASLASLLFCHKPESSVSMYSLVQTLDAGGSLLLLIGLAILSLWSIEQRVRRRKALQAINQLRDLAHIIDMKQLTKDPDGLARVSNPTKHSPKRDLDAFALGRYLDYCTEMLSLTSKLGYLYVVDFHDPETTRAVNELENLCTGLSRKIWQKIMILRSQTSTHASACATQSEHHSM